MLNLLLLFALSAAHAADFRPSSEISACVDELPFGVPNSTAQNTTLICREGYALQHDNSAKIALWAGWTLLPEETIGCNPREDAFAADVDVPEGSRALPSDYAKSGYDKGHMVPDADMSWSKQTSIESFLMSNMSPQLPNLNRGAWKYPETNERAWAWVRKHNITVYAGNIYKMGGKTIGTNKVVVPDALFKILIDGVTGEVMAFIFPNVAKQEIDLRARLVSVSQIEAQTGITFPLPTSFDKNAVGPIWPDPGDTTSAKKATCSVKLVK